MGARRLRDVRNAFVDQHVLAVPGIAAVSANLSGGQPELVVAVGSDSDVVPPHEFQGVPVRVVEGKPGRVAVGARFPQ